MFIEAGDGYNCASCVVPFGSPYCSENPFCKGGTNGYFNGELMGLENMKFVEETSETERLCSKCEVYKDTECNTKECKGGWRGYYEEPGDSDWVKPSSYIADPSEPPLDVRPPNALDVQVGGGHYKDLQIQPVEYIHKNKLGYAEGNIVKYISRHRSKGGAEDIKKVIHYAELILELEYKG